MKMKLTFLLLASVFFVSCGMPTIFNPNSSEYTFLKTTIDPVTTLVQGKLIMDLDSSGPNYELLENSDTKGPSLMFFYTFDDGNDINYTLTSSQIGIIASKFKEEYVKNNYDGIPVDASKEILSITINDSVNNNKEVYLYGVSPLGVSNKFTATDQYVLFAEFQRNGASLDPFTLTKTDSGSPVTGYTLVLNDKTTPSLTFKSNAEPSNKLYTFDGESFSLEKKTIQNKIINSSNHEYDYLGQNENSEIIVPDLIRIHLFAAFFISGNFSNNFWSNLIHLGAIPITLQP